jgi:hypothetical protein
MFLIRPRVIALLCAALLILSPYSAAFDTPLSDTSVREAYFLGQRHDDSLAQLLNKYVQYLQAPQTGPYIQSVSFLTPYILTAINSSEHVSIYSAQQAQIDHNKTPEIVRVTVQIWLTDSYGPYMVRPTSSDAHAVKGFAPRPDDFWRDFRVRVLQKDEMVLPVNAKGQPNYRCEEDACILTGATVYFEFPAEGFTPDTITVMVTPPEGGPVSVDFDPASLR